jgi:hypothetical protein
LLTGRHVVENPAEGVWASGNFYTGNWMEVANFIQQFPGGDDRMVLLGKLRKIYGIYKYRDAGHNRHGHGNDFPSFWALGFKSLREMRGSVPPDQFLAYLRNHCQEKQCCIPPKESERLEVGL